MQVQDDFDGKRLRKSVMRKTVDYNSSIIKALEVKTDEYFPDVFLTFFRRIEFGNEIIATDELFNPRTATFPT